MQYGKLLLVSLITAVISGCAVTNPSSQTRPADAPPNLLIKSGGEEASTDVKASYSTASSGGMMTGASISVATPSADASSVPKIPNASEVTTPVGAQTAIPSQQTTTVAQNSSMTGGFSVAMPYQKAWTNTGKALPSAGYPIMEKDDSTGTYYVLDKASSGGKVQRDTPIYQVRLTKAGDNTHITLLNASSQQAPAEVSDRILGALKSKLS